MRLRLLWAPAAVTAFAAACATAPATTALRAPEPVEIAPAAPASPGVAEIVLVETELDAGPPAEPPLEAPDLSPIWTTEVDPDVRQIDQLAVARRLRDELASTAAAFARAATAKTNVKATFAARQTLLERAVTAYARAANARDADDARTIAAMSEAAESMLAWSSTLDGSGLTQVPADWRSDPTLRLSFEDIAQGPAKRWRSEGAALARRCVRFATDAGVASTEAGRCRELDARYGRVVKTVSRADAGATACACDRLDPLCSSSLGPWCPR